MRIKMVIGKYSEFIELQARYPRKISNDYMLQGDVQRRLTNGALSFYADDKALFIFEQREGYIKLQFRLIDTSAVLPPHNGSIAAYLAYREGRYPEKAAQWLREQGFSYRKSLLRHYAKELTDGSSYERVEKASADEIYSMVGEYFEPAESDMPPRELFEPSGVYCARAPDGKIIGLVYDMGQTRVVAVSPEARGQGVGRRLYRAYAQERLFENNASVFHEWISPDNTASLAMFRSLGFVPDTAMSDCYAID